MKRSESIGVAFDGRNSRHVTAHFAIWYIAYHDGPTLTAAQIRSWAHRGKVEKAGRDHAGYALYNLETLIDHLRETGRIDNELPSCNY